MAVLVLLPGHDRFEPVYLCLLTFEQLDRSYSKLIIFVKKNCYRTSSLGDAVRTIIIRHRCCYSHSYVYRIYHCSGHNHRCSSVNKNIKMSAADSVSIKQYTDQLLYKYIYIYIYN